LLKFSSFAASHLLKNLTVRKILFICFGMWLCGLLAHADTFQLNDGRALTGEPLFSTAGDTGLKIKTGEGEYEQVPWTAFSQEDLKKFQQQPKLALIVEPFIEITQEEKLKKTEVKINPVPRLERPEAHSLFGAMFSSGLGALIMLLLYAANLYAGYEVALFRARPPAVVCGVSAVLPVVGPIIFLSLPTLIDRAAEQEAQAELSAAAAAAATVADSSPLAPDPAHAATAPGGLHIAHAEAAPAAASLPETQTFQRGAFTFNRRFFETKFPGFFGVVRRDAEKDMVLVIKSARGNYHGQRISRITGNDLHLEVHKGHASEEVLIPFTEVKEVQLKHKDAP
jgi:hypothetical protein